MAQASPVITYQAQPATLKNWAMTPSNHTYGIYFLSKKKKRWKAPLRSACLSALLLKKPAECFTLKKQRHSASPSHGPPPPRPSLARGGGATPSPSCIAPCAHAAPPSTSRRRQEDEACVIAILHQVGYGHRRRYVSSVSGVLRHVTSLCIKCFSYFRYMF
jgi:hypothetical protein